MADKFKYPNIFLNKNVEVHIEVYWYFHKILTQGDG